jgi:hypothetical protein
MNRGQRSNVSHEAEIPDKSGELLTRSGAQEIIEELRGKAAAHRARRETSQRARSSRSASLLPVIGMHPFSS